MAPGKRKIVRAGVAPPQGDTGGLETATAFCGSWWRRGGYAAEYLASVSEEAVAVVLSTNDFGLTLIVARGVGDPAARPPVG